MSRRGKGDRIYDTVDGESSDEANLVMSDSELTSGRTKKYAVSAAESGGRRGFPKCSRNEWICIVLGGVVILALLAIFVAIGVVFRVMRSQSSSSSSGGDLWGNVRLPSSISPEDYVIHLTVDIEAFTVDGGVVINLNIVEETSYILIHTKSMNISSFSVVQNNQSIAVVSNFTYKENDFFVIILKNSLAIGKATLKMSFSYILSDGLVGFYRSSYKDANGSMHWIATTHFEPTDARKAFPCFDEPALKANFTISITHSSSLNAHSNMPVVSQIASTRDRMVTTSFDTSVKMSTYLVAFVVSNFQCLTRQTDTVHKVNVSVCSNPDVLQHTGYALDKASDILKFYEDYFNIPYPLPKQDLFAIPDFAAGAMENWGLITYRETELLYDETVNPEISKESVAVVIAHELAHQWFGNLVTMEWWDGLWLNEGFATFTEYIGTNATEPTFDMPELFLVDDVFRALAADGVNESHPIIQTVSNPDEINELFDSISYSKGGTVIRMIRNILTVEKFQEGITRYLEKSEFGNAKTQQLWDALQSVVEDPHLNVTEIMDTWTLQMGYPVLQVNTSSGEVTQERFFDLKPNGTIAPSPYGYVWLVPFDYLTEKNNTSAFVKSTFRIIREKEETVDFPSDKGFIKVNVEQSGFYRVNYDLSNWHDIISHLHSNPKSEVLTSADRAGLLEDAFGLSSAGLLDTRVALNLSQYIRDEREYVPCLTGLIQLSSIGARLSLTPVYGLYQEFVRNLTTDLAQEFNFNRTDLDHLQIFLRTTVLSSAWFYGNTDVINVATKLFQGWMEHNETVSANVKSVVFSVGIAYGGETEWDFIWQQYLTTSDPYEKRLYLSALAKSRTPWILSRYLEYAIDSTKVRTQDSITVIRYVSANVHGRYLTWNFVRNNWDVFLKRYGGGSFSFSGLIKSVTAHFTTELELKEVERFFQEQANLAAGARAVRQSIELIKRNIHWLKTNQDVIQDCLSDTQSCFSSSS